VNYNLSAGISTPVPEEPYIVTYNINSVPNGTTFNTSTGALTGNPTTPGTNNFTVTATNSYKTEGRAYSIEIMGSNLLAGGIRLSGGVMFP